MSAVFHVWNSSGLLLLNTKFAFIKKGQGQHFSEKSSVRPLSDWSTRRFEKPCLVPANFDWLHSAAEEPPQPVPKILALALVGLCTWSEIQKPKQCRSSPVLLLPSQFRSWNWDLFVMPVTCASRTTAVAVTWGSRCPWDVFDRGRHLHLTISVGAGGNGVLVPGCKRGTICSRRVLQVLQLGEMLGSGDAHARLIQLLNRSSSSRKFNVCSPSLPYNAILVSRGIFCLLCLQGRCLCNEG